MWLWEWGVYFEPLVQCWLSYWHTVFGEIGKVRGWDNVDEFESVDDKVITSTLSEEIAQAVKTLLAPDISMIVRRTDQIAKATTDINNRQKILAKDILTLQDVSELTGICTKTLSKSHHNDMEEYGRDENKLNGYRKGRHWQFHRHEYLRYEELLEKRHERLSTKHG